MSCKTVLLVSGAASFSTRDVWEGYRDGLNRQGIRVIPYSTFSMLRMLSHESVGNDIVGKALDVRNGVDAVAFIDGLYFRGEKAWVPITIREAGKPAILIATDDPYDSLEDPYVLYSHYFTNEQSFAPRADNVLLTATVRAPDPVAYLAEPLNQGEPLDMVFIGTLFHDRLPMMQRLCEFCGRHDIRFHIAGNMIAETASLEAIDGITVEKRTIRPAEKWSLYSRSKVVLNLFRESEAEPISPSPRIFEVGSLGGPALLSGVRRPQVTEIYGDSIYEFDTAEEMESQVLQALGDDDDRQARVTRAKEITNSGHLYQHRAQKLVTVLNREMAQANRSAPEDRLAWIIGCGRTGSTWLTEMLDDVPGISSWNEPYYGRFFRQLADRPNDRKRPPAFFNDHYHQVWKQGLRDLFYSMAEARFPQFGKAALVVKEVNTPEFFPLIDEVFPASKIILLLRDPFDILDSYIDMNRPGSWNRKAGDFGIDSITKWAQHIQTAMTSALDAFDAFPRDRRLQIRYEDVLENPADALQRCARLLGVEATDAKLDAIVQQHEFDNHQQKGKLAFRRFGKAGIWEQSGNFTEEVRQIADEILGSLRSRLQQRQEDS